MSDNGGNALIRIDGDVTEPVTVLIKKISKALGSTYEPTKIKKVAKAKAKAKVTETKADIKSDDLQIRASRRREKEDIKHQRNMERITRKAAPLLTDDSSPQELDEDWLSHFFDKCRITSDGEMQSLWARILAGQSNAPGSFSRQTVDLVSNLEKSDAHNFTKLCQFVWDIEEASPLIHDTRSGLPFEAGITFDLLIHLEYLGLIRTNFISGFVRNEMTSQTIFKYFDRWLRVPDGWVPEELSVGMVLFTRAGLELFPICGANGRPDFFEQMLILFDSYGLKLTEDK